VGAEVELKMIQEQLVLMVEMEPLELYGVPIELTLPRILKMLKRRYKWQR
jgi:hypothetical protein